MNWDQIEGKWKEYAGKIKSKWGKLTDDDLTVVGGKKDQLVGVIQQRYGIAKDQAEKQVDEFTRSFSAENAARREENARADKDRARGAGSR
ncbi:MAG TPA: CsbD family protein [Candidatus Dormibacteraeota bacterium]|nr:CsbD family protein [Candidatus Dormibacteraeota bacterium]